MELVRQYLSALTPQQIDALEHDGAELNLDRASLPVASRALADALRIKLLPAPRAAGAVVKDDKVSAWITARSDDASVTLEVVYQLGGAPVPPAPTRRRRSAAACPPAAISASPAPRTRYCKWKARWTPAAT